MYLLHPHNRLYAAVAGTKSLYRYVGTVALLALITACWWMSIYSYSKALENSYKAEIAIAHAAQKAYHGAQRSRKRLHASLEAVQEELSHYKNNQRKSYDWIQMAIMDLIIGAERSDLIVSSCTLGKRHANEHMNGQEVVMVWQGSFTAIQSFLNSLKDQSLLEFQRIQLTSSDSRMATLSCSCIVHTLT